MKTAEKTKQFVVNISEEDKATVNTLKEELGLSDKSLLHVVLKVALNNRDGLINDGPDGPLEVDTFKLIAKSLGLVKAKEKVVLTPEEKERAKLERQLANIQKKLEAATTEVAAEESSEEVEDEPETLVEVGV